MAVCGSKSFRGSKDHELVGFSQSGRSWSSSFSAAGQAAGFQIALRGPKKSVVAHGIKCGHAVELARLLLRGGVLPPIIWPW